MEKKPQKVRQTSDDTNSHPVVYVRTIGFTPPHYEFFDEQKQKIESFELIEGKSYNFIALESLSSHPFQLNNDASSILRLQGDSYILEVPIGAISIEYICSFHSSIMKGSIPVKKEALQKFQRDQYKDFQIEVQALKDFINFEAIRADGSLIQRNVFNFDLFADGGKSNPSYSAFVFQRELNIALKNQSIDASIREDGFFGVNTAKALQKLINSYIEDPADNVSTDGKIVSSIMTSRALGKTIDAMIKNNEPFVFELLRFIEKHGTLQQQGIFPLATNTVEVAYIDV
jgi:hypothetical protein